MLRKIAGRATPKSLVSSEPEFAALLDRARDLDYTKKQELILRAEGRYAGWSQAELQDEFFSQIIASAMNLGKKYHYDEAHSRHAAKFALTIFDALVNEHGMNSRDRMLLETAATLHDVGMFVRTSAHHKHGQYIVSNSEIFGLHGDELAIVANIIGYHRGAAPQSTDFEYMALQREERILVLKMISILRIADALDRGHSQQIKNITVERKADTVIITAEGAYDVSLERLSLEEKGMLFQDVFGYRVLLMQAG